MSENNMLINKNLQKRKNLLINKYFLKKKNSLKKGFLSITIKLLLKYLRSAFNIFLRQLFQVLKIKLLKKE